jgi:hypothetical protein
VGGAGLAAGRSGPGPVDEPSSSRLSWWEAASTPPEGVNLARAAGRRRFRSGTASSAIEAPPAGMPGWPRHPAVCAARGRLRLLNQQVCIPWHSRCCPSPRAVDPNPYVWSPARAVKRVRFGEALAMRALVFPRTSAQMGPCGGNAPRWRAD